VVALLRATVLHTPQDPFRDPDALQAFEDGAVAIEGERIAALGPYDAVRRTFPEAPVEDLRPAYLTPGFVDIHVHYPQIRITGRLSTGLLDWLERVALPEEARLADAEYARDVARTFVRCLLRNGTVAALVFGAHFPAAQNALFEEAHRAGLWIASGLVLSDRNLRPELHQTPVEAEQASVGLIERWHGRARSRYVVMPRFALSTSEAMLAVCQELLRSFPDVLFHTHLNESPEEIAAVQALFPDQEDYLAAYEAFDLVGPRSVFAHNVHPTDDELRRLGAGGAWVAHCPSSNLFIGSGLFPLRRHLRFGVRVALGSDVGGGTGPSLLKEGLAAYQVQQVHSEGFRLGAAHLLYLATRAGAEALGLAHEMGDLRPGQLANLVGLPPPEGGTLGVAVRPAPSPEAALAVLFALGGEHAVDQVYLAGRPVYRHGSAASR